MPKCPTQETPEKMTKIIPNMENHLWREDEEKRNYSFQKELRQRKHEKM